MQDGEVSGTAVDTDHCGSSDSRVILVRFVFSKKVAAVSNLRASAVPPHLRFHESHAQFGFGGESGSLCLPVCFCEAPSAARMLLTPREQFVLLSELLSPVLASAARKETLRTLTLYAFSV